jgi:hypothetical protein
VPLFEKVPAEQEVQAPGPVHAEQPAPHAVQTVSAVELHAAETYWPTAQLLHEVQLLVPSPKKSGRQLQVGAPFTTAQVALAAQVTLSQPGGGGAVSDL